jgi:predicted nicotinamide N-methyase
MKLFLSVVALLAAVPTPSLTQTLPGPTTALVSAANFMIVQGRVLDAATGQGLPGVTVLLKGTAKSVGTDAQGYYTLANVPALGASLVLISAGYRTQERPVLAEQMPDVKLLADPK